MKRWQRAGIGLVSGGLVGLAPAGMVYAMEQGEQISQDSVLGCHLGKVALQEVPLPPGCRSIESVFTSDGAIGKYDLPAAADLPKTVQQYESSQHREDVGLEIGIVLALGVAGAAGAAAWDGVPRSGTAIDFPAVAETV